MTHIEENTQKRVYEHSMNKYNRHFTLGLALSL